MLSSYIFLVMFVIVGVRSGAFATAARMLSRIFVSGERREVPKPVRGGGVAGLAEGLAALVTRGRELSATIEVLRELSPAYHRTFEEVDAGLLDDRRRHALRRDFEDAMIYVTRALDAWCVAHRQLDPQGRLMLARIGGELPDVEGVLRRFPWLPRRVVECGTIHYRADEQVFERALFEIDDAVQRLETSLTYEAHQAYR